MMISLTVDDISAIKVNGPQYSSLFFYGNINFGFVERDGLLCESVQLSIFPENGHPSRTEEEEKKETIKKSKHTRQRMIVICLLGRLSSLESCSSTHSGFSVSIFLGLLLNPFEYYHIFERETFALKRTKLVRRYRHSLYWCAYTIRHPKWVPISYTQVEILLPKTH